MSVASKLKSKLHALRMMLVDRFWRPVVILAGKINYPGEEDISLLDIGNFFVEGLRKGDIQSRARAISFDFFLAIFPTVIFFFTLIPYIPVEGIQDRILFLLQEVLPPY